jgi:hypothetical protein
MTEEKAKFVTVNMESATGEDLGKVSYIPLPNVDYIPKQKKMYSEEEVLKILHDYRNHFELYRNLQVLPNMFFQWFEQFKKK